MLDEFILHFNEVVESTTITPYTAALRLSVAFVLGAIVGVERQLRRRDAGMRTFSLICMGSAAAMIISIWLPQTYPNFLNGDPGRIAAQVLTGIGFLGAGAIIQGHGSIHGLTTAACIWVMAVIGLAAGAGMFVPAGITTFLALSILISLERLEKRMFLNGVNKILTIHCSTSTPEWKAIRQILVAHKVYIVSVSYDNNYENNTAIVTYKVNVKAISSYSELFKDIRALGYISQIRLLV